MSEKRFKVDYEVGVLDTETDEIICDTVSAEKVVDLLNEQQDQIIYWKHKVISLLWILSQFDEEKVKKLLKEIDDE